MKKLKRICAVLITLCLMNSIVYPAYGMKMLSGNTPLDKYDVHKNKSEAGTRRQIKNLAENLNPSEKAEQEKKDVREDLEVSNLLISERFVELFSDDEVEIRRLLRKIGSMEGRFCVENIKKLLEKESETFGINAEKIEELSKLIPVAIMGTVTIDMVKKILAGETPAIPLTNVGIDVSEKFAKAVDDLLDSVYTEKQKDVPAAFILEVIYARLKEKKENYAKKQIFYLWRRAYNAGRIGRAENIFSANAIKTVANVEIMGEKFDEILDTIRKLSVEAERDASQYYAMQVRAFLLAEAAKDAGANLSPIDVPDGFKGIVHYALNSKNGSKDAEKYAKNIAIFLLMAIVEEREKGEELARYLFRQVRLLRGQEDFGWTAEDIVRWIRNRMEGGSYTISNRNIPEGFSKSYDYYTTYYPSKIREEFAKNRGLSKKKEVDLRFEPAQGMVDRRLFAEAKEIFEEAEKSSLLYLARAVNYEPVMGISQFDLLSMRKGEYTNPRRIFITASTFYNKEGKPKPFVADFLSKLAFVLPFGKELVVVAPHEDKELIKELKKSLECTVIGPTQANKIIAEYIEDNMVLESMALIDASFLEKEDLSKKEKEWVVKLRKKAPEQVITIGKVREDQRSLDLLAALSPFVREEAREKFLGILADTCLKNGVSQEQTAGIVYAARMKTFNWVITPSDIKLAGYQEAEQEYWADREPIEGMN